MGSSDLKIVSLTSADMNALRLVSEFEKESDDFSEEKRFWSINCRPLKKLTDEQRAIKRYIYEKLMKYRNGKLGNLNIIAQRSKVAVVTIRDMINAVPTPYGTWVKVGRAIEAIEREDRIKARKESKT